MTYATTLLSQHVDEELSRLAGVPFTKMCGAGNDFIVIDNRRGSVPDHLMSPFTQRLCRRRLSIGADGAVFISEPPAGDPAVEFRWRYINADGSEVEMCGNGAMCGARFAFREGIAGSTCRFLTPSGPVEATVDPDGSSVRLAMPDPGPLQSGIALSVDGIDARLHAIEVGVPHAVWVTEDADAFADDDRFARIGRLIRRHERFAPAGVNVNIVSARPDGTIRMRTYERGVEAETLACGTGAVATAVVGTALGLTGPPVDIVTSSGAVLTVSFDWDARRARAVTLAGEARVILAGQVGADAFDTWERT